MDYEDYSGFTVDELDEEITERNSRYGKAGGMLLNTTGLKADKIATLQTDDARLDAGEDSGVTANAVRDLSDEAKTGPLRRREAREERLAGEAALYKRQHAEEGA